MNYMHPFQLFCLTLYRLTTQDYDKDKTICNNDAADGAADNQGAVSGKRCSVRPPDGTHPCECECDGGRREGAYCHQ